MGNIPKPGKRRRRHRTIGATPAGQKLYAFFVRPFLDRLGLRFDQKEFDEGLDWFFDVNRRPISWCKAKEPFRIPGPMWTTPDRPHDRIDGTGDRLVHRGSHLVVRQDFHLDRVEIEYRDQVFVLTPSQYDVIKDKLRAIV